MPQNPNDVDVSLSVIPIAKFVFNDKRIRECVSDDFEIKQLVIKIINSANDLDFVDALPRQQNLKMLVIWTWNCGTTKNKAPS